MEEPSGPQYSQNLQESWSRVNHAARDLAKVFSVTILLVTIVGQLVKTPPPPPQQKVSRHIIAILLKADFRQDVEFLMKLEHYIIYKLFFDFSELPSPHDLSLT